MPWIVNACHDPLTQWQGTSTAWLQIIELQVSMAGKVRFLSDCAFQIAELASCAFPVKEVLRPGYIDNKKQFHLFQNGLSQNSSGWQIMVR
jgi:hypothetical protein